MAAARGRRPARRSPPAEGRSGGARRGRPPPPASRGRTARSSDEQLRVGADDGEAEVAVVEDGERRRAEALVRHAVLDDDARRAEARRQPALEAQVLAEEPALARLALDLQHVVLAAPLLPHAHVLRGQVGRAAVQAEALALRVGRAVVGESAGRDEAAAERPEPADARGLVERGRAEGGVQEGEGATRVLRGADVDPAVEQDEEAEARSQSTPRPRGRRACARRRARRGGPRRAATRCRRAGAARPFRTGWPCTNGICSPPGRRMIPRASDSIPARAGPVLRPRRSRVRRGGRGDRARTHMETAPPGHEGRCFPL